MFSVYIYCWYIADLSLYNKITLCQLFDEELCYKIKICST